MDSEFNKRAHMDRKSGDKMIHFIIFFIFVIMILIANFSSSKIGVSLEYDGSFNIYGVKSTFWGLKKEWYEIKYFPETSNRVGGWYAREKDGEWSIMLLEREDDYYDHYDY